MRTTYIPVNLTLEVARHIVGLGQWEEFEQIIRHIQERVPEARAVSVWLDDMDILPQDHPTVILCAELTVTDPRSLEDSDPRERELDTWVRDKFPPEVATHFIPMIARGYDDEG